MSELIFTKRQQHLRWPKRCLVCTTNTNFYQKEEGKVGHTENKEKERNNVTDLGGHVTVYLHVSSPLLSVEQRL